MELESGWGLDGWIKRIITRTVWFFSAGLFGGIGDSGVAMPVATLCSGVSSAVLQMIKGSNRKSIFSTSTPHSYYKTGQMTWNHRIWIRIRLHVMFSLWYEYLLLIILSYTTFLSFDTQGRGWDNEFDWKDSLSLCCSPWRSNQSLWLKSATNDSHAIPLPTPQENCAKSNFIAMIERSLISYFG